MDSALNEELNILFEKFSNEVKNILGNNIKSIIIYGSVALGGFIKGKGDIDYICIINDNLCDEEIRKIHDLHENIRNGSLGELGVQLEGAYYSLPMMCNMKEAIGRGYYMGTNKNRWREVSKVGSLNCMDRLMMIRHGIVIYGEKKIDYLKEPRLEEIKEEFLENLQNNIEWSKKGNSVYFSIEMVYFAARGLNTLKTGQLLSKGKACEWFVLEYEKSKWRDYVGYTSKFRYPLSKQEEEIINRAYIINNTTPFLEDIYRVLTIAN